MIESGQTRDSFNSLCVIFFLFLMINLFQVFSLHTLIDGFNALIGAYVRWYTEYDLLTMRSIICKIVNQSKTTRG